jgi:dynein heavy chain 1
MESSGSGIPAAKEDSESLSNAVSVEKVVRYIKNVVHLVSEADDVSSSISNDLDQALSDRANLTVISRFITEAQMRAISIQRTVLRDDTEERESRAPSEEPTGSGATTTRSKYYVDVGVGYRGGQATVVTMIKRGPVIEADKPLHSQLTIANLNEDSPFETLHSYVRDVVGPFFKSFVQASGKADRDGDKMVPSVQKNISELEIGLLHLQQNIDIPEITLVVHPVVLQVVKKAEEEGRKPKVQDFGDIVEVSTFLNALQKDVNRWIREIQKVTKLERDPSSGTAMQEIGFWLNLERALYRIQEKREGTEIQLTLDVLKHGKRFHATVSFDSDTGLQAALTRVKDSSVLMKEFPLQDLLAATDLKQIQLAVVAIFTHLKKIRNTQYSVSRALKLIEAISRDLSSQFLKVLSSSRLVHMPYDEFGKIVTDCNSVFQAWDEEHEKLINLLRDLVRKKRDDSIKMLWRAQLHHKKLQTRLEQLQKFRKQHNQLCYVITRVLTSGSDTVHDAVAEEVVPGPSMEEADDPNAIDDVEAAYESVKAVNPLDISKEGSDIWDEAIKRYEERINRVEARITARLRDQLGIAKNANEMFRIFSRYNVLFVRPHIRGAIREYQAQLIQRVKDDIEQLHNKFKVQYPNTTAYDMSKLRDLPPVSGSIIWARQIDRQLTTYLKRVEDVLGKGWEGHLEGQQLKQDGESFRQKLNTQQVYEEWIHKVSQRQLGVSGRIFSIVAQRGRSGQKGQQLRLVVNFQPEIITLAKEVRNLKWLGFRVPLAIVSKAHQANQQYPFAISLMESVRTYERTCEKIQEHSTIAPLIARHKKDVQSLIQEGMGVSWESFKLNPYVEKLNDCVITFQEKVESLLVSENHIQRELRALETCQYKSSTFGDILTRIQKTVDELNLHSYSNLGQWVSTLDKRIEDCLAGRLQHGIASWTERLLSFVSKGAAVQESLADTDTTVGAVIVHKQGGDPDFTMIHHEIHIKNQVLFLDPPLEEAQYQLLKQFQKWMNIICLQTRIQSARYQVSTVAYMDMDYV